MYQCEILPHSFEARMKVNILEGSLWHFRTFRISLLECLNVLDRLRLVGLQRGGDVSNELRKGNRTSPIWIKPNFPSRKPRNKVTTDYGESK